jgi:indolepyruvate ferredoxin oxidoreductase
VKHSAMTLDDKYAVEIDQVYLTGTQALVRLPLLQRHLDVAAGLNTAGFISGYRGSPLGSVDIQLWQARKHLEAQHIHFQPGVNEEAGATAVWGSQQVTLFPAAKYDGVFAFWYGKGPGVDRCGDVFKHANFAGTAPHGGVLLVAGDDHACKSSTVPNQSEQALIAATIPVFAPGDVADILNLGLHGWAMSRYSGLYTGFKTVADIIDSSASISFDVDGLDICYPGGDRRAPGDLGIRLHDKPLDQERRIHEFSLPAVHAYVRANRLDRIVRDDREAMIGIVTAGKSYADVRQALADLGLADGAQGLRVLKLALTWPVEPEIIREFAAGLHTILVVEEKRSLIEAQIKDILYGGRAQPVVVGKALLRPDGELSATDIALAAGELVQRLRPSEQLAARLGALRGQADQIAAIRTSMERPAFYCSGCPHNTSTKVIDGSRALAGIGCHYMATSMDRQTDTFSQMGGEGVAWIGQAPFTEEKHVFANLGDGTYFHSGILAIRAAVASGVNITYKLLFNDAVAMTGGQPIEGSLTVPQITRQLAAEGVVRIVIVTDEPEKYHGVKDLAVGVQVRERHLMQQTERELRDVAGCTVLIYDQTCASEKRRKRKRGTMADPARRVFINERVCEGCGDCSRTSNCISVVPVETEFGRKRAIDQSSCNKDFSCVDGFCPSFVSVLGGQPRRSRADMDAFSTLPEPVLPALDKPFNLLVAGIGGTGVVTIGALLGVAAHAEGKHVTVLDQMGMAQKGGSVLSHIKIAACEDQLQALRVSQAAADLLLACDPVVGAGRDAIAAVLSGVTRAVVNRHAAITADFPMRGVTPDVEKLLATISAAVGPGRIELIEATDLATALVGDAIATNLFMLGFAWQRGLIPIGHAALMQAIEMNGTAVAANKAAFRWGRCAAVDPAGVAEVAGVKPAAVKDATMEQLAAELVRYQGRGYARRYRQLVEAVAAAEARVEPGDTRLSTVVARCYYKLLAYKDEYEVARLYASDSFRQALAERFEGDVKLQFHLAPPFLAKRDPATGHLQKRVFGGWVLPVFHVLARFKFLRGTALDPFGRTEERQAERQLIADYETMIGEVAASLRDNNREVAIELAAIPDRIAGYGHVKERSMREAAANQASLLARFHAEPDRLAAD